jgi:hypothetical protein
MNAKVNYSPKAVLLCHEFNSDLRNSRDHGNFISWSLFQSLLQGVFQSTSQLGRYMKPHGNREGSINNRT